MWYDRKDKSADSSNGSVALGALWVRLIACFWLGSFGGVYVGVSPFWEQRPDSLGRLGFALAWSLPLGLIGGFVYLLVRTYRDARKQATISAAAETTAAAQEEKAEASTETTEKTFAGLLFGRSTAELYSRDHVGGMPPGEPIFASKEDCCKNTIIFGGIGSGKTTRAINPLLKQIFEQQAGALVFNIKSDFDGELGYIAGITGRSYLTVGHGGLTLNLIRGTTPELAASYLKSCFIASGSAGGNAAFFVDQAVELCRNALTILMLTGGDYTLAGLYDLVFSDEKRQAAIDLMVSRSPLFDYRQSRLSEAAGNYFDNIYDKFDDKMLSSVNTTVAQVLSPFSHPDLIDAFSCGNNDDEADLTELLNGAIYFVSLPMTLFGKEGSKYAYMLIKLRFMSLIRERRTRPEWNQETPVAFVCDEYQAIVDSITDSDFWDKSRSAGCFGLVSMQGVSSLQQAVGSKQTADAILQNFRQRLIFRTEDDATMQMAQRLLGQVDVLMVSTSEGSNQGSSKSQQGPGQLLGQLGTGGSGSNSISEGSNYGESTSIQRQQLFDANDFRRLSTDYGLFVGNIGDHAVDEVIQMQPLYVKKG